MTENIAAAGTDEPIVHWKATIKGDREGYYFVLDGTWVGEALTDEELHYTSSEEVDVAMGTSRFYMLEWAQQAARQKAEEWTNQIRRAVTATDVVEEYDL